MNAEHYIKGRGAQINTTNRFLKLRLDKQDTDAIDDWEEASVRTVYIEEHVKSIVNKVDSPDVRMEYSMNPYSGCEHGCIYCFARNAHEYHGFSAGLDFESKILVKVNAPELLHDFLMKPKWECRPITMSGNTDCYQPAEQKFRLTRQLLEICYQFKQPANIITKNAFVENDVDLLSRMAAEKLTSVIVSLTSLDERTRRLMEPRTTTAKQKLQMMRVLSDAGVRVGVMIGPVIPGINDYELLPILEAAKDHGASFSGYTYIRLNGAISLLFHDWLYKNFPDRADKVWHLIQQSHDGKVNDSRWGLRMRGEGPIATIIAEQFKNYSRKFSFNKDNWRYDTSSFVRPGQQLQLF